MLARGPHVTTLNYRGQIGTGAEGFFIDKYPTPSGEKLVLGTQFEPTDARRVFPCWDEPVYRATHDITLVVPEKLMAVANMPIERETRLPGGLKEVVFARTPAMASYLVALYAGEFEAVEGEQDGVKLRILTTEGKKASALYALESTKRLLACYNQYFGVKYPLPKLDQIAVPNAFATFGAMENWGCITYIDTALLYNPVTSSQEGRERVFGDLVTMACSQLITALGQCGDPAVIGECTRRFEAYPQDPASLPGSLRGPVLQVVGRYASPETYAQLHVLARAALTTEEKRRAYAGMQVAGPGAGAGDARPQSGPGNVGERIHPQPRFRRHRGRASRNCVGLRAPAPRGADAGRHVFRPQFLPAPHRRGLQRRHRAPTNSSRWCAPSCRRMRWPRPNARPISCAISRP